MTLNELIKECDYGTSFELHNAEDGKMVANTKKGLEKYGTVQVIGFHPCIKYSNTCGNSAIVKAILYVWGSSYDIQKVKERSGK